MVSTSVIAGSAGRYVHWGVIQISVTNLLIIIAMVIVFALAIVVPFRTSNGDEGSAEEAPIREEPVKRHEPLDPTSWTIQFRNRIVGLVPPGQALPHRQPAYVASWIYVFGVLTLAALFVVIASGGILAMGGSAWYHTSSFGLYINSIHLWSVELFFAFMVVHLWGKFWMAAWRGRRTLTWITGVVLFVTSIGAAFTGYLSQSNFDSQWISGEAKDGLNSVGIGAFFNVLNPGQMLLWHVALLPFGVAVLTLVHIILVRRHGVVPPLDAVVAIDPVRSDAS